MLAKQQGRMFIDEWVLEKLLAGSTTEEMNGTTFVFGNELLTLKQDNTGEFYIEPQSAPEIGICDQGHTLHENMCQTCGMEHSTYKEVLQCCSNID